MKPTAVFGVVVSFAHLKLNDDRDYQATLMTAATTSWKPDSSCPSLSAGVGSGRTMRAGSRDFLSRFQTGKSRTVRHRLRNISAPPLLPPEIFPPPPAVGH